MANPTRTEIETQTANVIRILNEIRKFGGINAVNYLTLEDTAVQALETDFYASATAGVAGMRSGLNQALASASGALTPFLQTYGRFLTGVDQAPETDVDSILLRLRDDFITGTRRVTSRGFTFGSPAAGGGNVGTGVINRLNRDEDNFDIENQTPDAKAADCIQDANSGAPEHEELFEVRGAASPLDLVALGVDPAVVVPGSGRIATIKALSARDSEAFIDNPSFSQFSGTTAVPTDITGWTIAAGAIGNFELDQLQFYRGFSGDTTPTAIRYKANATLRQDLTARGSVFSPRTPYYIQLAYNITPGAVTAGTLTLSLGAATVSVDLSLAAAGWQILRIPVGSTNWFKTFNASPLRLDVALTGFAGTYLLIDDVITAPYTAFDGSYYAIVGGVTKFEKDDIFTWSDSVVVATEGKIQHWLWRTFGRYLPHTTGGGVTWADPL